MSIDQLRREAQAIVNRAEAAGRSLSAQEEDRLDEVLGQVRDEEGREIRRRLAGDSDAGDHLYQDHHQAHPWTRAIQDHAARMGGGGFKDLALVPGGLDVPQFIPDIPLLGEMPVNFLQLLGRRPLPRETNGYSYLAETQRDQQAAAVALGEEKPTSTYVLELREGTAEVIAHLSEPINRFWLQDFRNLDQYVRDALLAGIDLALQEQCLYGTGVSPQLPGLIPQIGTAVSGDDVIVLIRRAMASLESEGIQATAVVLNTMDAAAVDLLQDAIGRYYGAGPFQGGPATLWGLPRVSTPALHQGEAVVGDFRSVILFVKDVINLQWSDSTADNWAKNLLTARCEGRFGLGVLRPFAFKLLDASQIGPGDGGEGRRRSAPSTTPATDPRAAGERKR